MAKGPHLPESWLRRAAFPSTSVAEAHLGEMRYEGGTYRWYAGYMDAHIIKADRKRATPAKVYMDGVEFMPTGKSVLFIAKV